MNRRAWEFLESTAAVLLGLLLIALLLIIGTVVLDLGRYQLFFWEIATLGVGLMPWNIVRRRRLEFHLWEYESAERASKGLNPRPFRHRPF